ncbi:hypothetical protein C8P63_1524 [Melghirimyces profundicolus]|uniref:Uncharacterized protein n=1 Tax=Melghirimyces profundicolus TaxID=1242148 RepID=A0A2T6AU82_9BACL|nr:hypothetical protein [Melghirimyces profundicolus]PTX47373.1 hypothetical protein C8P63_1524 [Melghirimyces profundicolus]
MRIKHLGIFFIIFAGLYTLVEVVLTPDGRFNLFLPFAMLVTGIVSLTRKDKNEKIFKRKNK